MQRHMGYIFFLLISNDNCVSCNIDLFSVMSVAFNTLPITTNKCDVSVDIMNSVLKSLTFSLWFSD